MSQVMSNPADVISFWRGLGYERWFKKDEALDADIRARFGALHRQAAEGALDDWETTDDGALALVILLDQFSRNLFRNDARAFAYDSKALGIASRALDRGADRRVDPELRMFFYLPFEHSEMPDDQDRSVALFTELGETDQLKYAIIHRDIIAKFGRFPHRNPVLGRTMTAEEQAYLDAEGFAG